MRHNRIGFQKPEQKIPNRLILKSHKKHSVPQDFLEKYKS